MSAATSKVKPAPLPPDTTLGGYRVVQQIAAGGFGLVYKAVDQKGRLVAIKEYLPSALSSRAQGQKNPVIQPDKLSLYRLGLKGFFEEGRALAQISHASVVRVLNFFRENETVYMVMNLLEGASLQEFVLIARSLKRPRIFQEETIYSLFEEILTGLRIVHQHRMLHLDIKPANIFITNQDKAVLIDFGAAREVINHEINFVRPMYTPGFAAPEMYRRKGELGPWTDIYAIGACIFVCMLGYPPNAAPQRLEKDRLGLALSKMRKVYSDNLIEMVEWCMALDPLARPQSVHALVKEMESDVAKHFHEGALSTRIKGPLDSVLGESSSSESTRKPSALSRLFQSAGRS